jgi:hypothetical protein
MKFLLGRQKMTMMTSRYVTQRDGEALLCVHVSPSIPSRTISS